VQFNFHSPDQLFTPPLQKYCRDKLAKPVARHKLEEEEVRFEIEAVKHGDSTGLRVLFHQPGVHITVSTLHADAYGAVDLAVDKLKRKLGDTEERRRALARRGPLPSLSDEVEDIFTEDEEEVLREMGALDAVLNL